MNKNIDFAEEWVIQLNAELESEKDITNATILENRIKTLKWLVKKAKRIKPMDDALAFYGEEDNYDWDIDDPYVSVKPSKTMQDNGDLARQARGLK